MHIRYLLSLNILLTIIFLTIDRENCWFSPNIAKNSLRFAEQVDLASLLGVCRTAPRLLNRIFTQKLHNTPSLSPSGVDGVHHNRRRRHHSGKCLRSERRQVPRIQGQVGAIWRGLAHRRHRVLGPGIPDDMTREADRSPQRDFGLAPKWDTIRRAQRGQSRGRLEIDIESSRSAPGLAMMRASEVRYPFLSRNWRRTSYGTLLLIA